MTTETPKPATSAARIVSSTGGAATNPIRPMEKMMRPIHPVLERPNLCTRCELERPAMIEATPIAVP